MVNFTYLVFYPQTISIFYYIFLENVGFEVWASYGSISFDFLGMGFVFKKMENNKNEEGAVKKEKKGTYL